MRNIWPVLWALLVVGCGQPEITQRTYREITTQAAAAEDPPGGSSGVSGVIPSGRVKVAWETPGGWQEQPGSGVRLATFTVDGAECTLTTFPGDVGGLRANLERWLGQLNVQVDSPQALDDFMSASEPAGGALSGRIFDFGIWVADDPSAPSMLAGVFEKSGSTIFVKLMGPRSVLSEQRGAFIGLCGSVR